MVVYLKWGRADYADDEQIIELLKWKHPYATHTESFHYTDEENAAMLRLPRKECLYHPIFALYVSAHKHYLA
jgi:hypothetical protein